VGVGVIEFEDMHPGDVQMRPPKLKMREKLGERGFSTILLGGYSQETN
jgi:hypothetical protein